MTRKGKGKARQASPPVTRATASFSDPVQNPTAMMVDHEPQVVPEPQATTSSIPQANLRLRCLIEGESAVFTVTVSANNEIGDLKDSIHEKGKNGVLRDVDAKDLVLLKVRYERKR
jgi:hypothetical protein